MESHIWYHRKLEVICRHLDLLSSLKRIPDSFGKQKIELTENVTYSSVVYENIAVKRSLFPLCAFEFLRVHIFDTSGKFALRTVPIPQPVILLRVDVFDITKRYEQNFQPRFFNSHCFEQLV